MRRGNTGRRLSTSLHYLLSGPHGGFLQSVGGLKLALAPVEGAQVLQGGGHRGAAETRTRSSLQLGVANGLTAALHTCPLCRLCTSRRIPRTVNRPSASPGRQKPSSDQEKRESVEAETAAFCLLTLLCSSLSSACIHMGLFSSAQKHIKDRKWLSRTGGSESLSWGEGGGGGMGRCLTVSLWTRFTNVRPAAFRTVDGAKLPLVSAGQDFFVQRLRLLELALLQVAGSLKKETR